jgi:hypothetical protein
VASRLGGDYFKTPALGRGLAMGDLDNDGWPDLVVSHSNSPVALLRNEAAKSQSPPARWIGLQLKGKDHRDIVGSTVVLQSGERRLTRFIKGGGSYLSASDPRVVIGLGAGEGAVDVTVQWSWGGTQTWKDLQPGGYWELKEGVPAAERVKLP